MNGEHLMTMSMTTTMMIKRSVWIGALVTGFMTMSAQAAERVVASVPGADFNVTASPVVQQIFFDAAEPITGVGFTADWTAVIADNENGVYPWSLDLAVAIEAPTGETFLWPVIGGDRTIADFPLQDFQPGFSTPGVTGMGTFEWTFTNTQPQPPYTMGLRNIIYHLTTQAPDVIEVRNDTTKGGPLWYRPFFIAGVSGLGPVSYHVIEFEAPVSGGYIFESVVPAGENNFTFLYQGGFNPGNSDVGGDTGQLENLLDYGLGNGNAPNGAPQGTSFIEALLLEGVRYYYVTSQWSRFDDPQPFVTTITGPAAIMEVAPCPADVSGDEMTSDGTVNVFDLLALLAAWNTNGAGADLAEPNDLVNLFDLLALLANWGPCG